LVDVNDVLVFLAVAESGSFTAAGHALLMPKTTVSRKVRELELQLGVQLLHRTTRRLGLTQAGTVYFEHCKKIPQSLIDANAAIGELQSRPTGTLRITCSYSLAISLVTPALAQFRTLYPEVRIDLVLSHRTLDLIEEKIDIALRMGDLPDSSLLARKLAVLSNRVYASPEYLARHGEPLHPNELRTHFALVTRVARFGTSYAWPMSEGGALKNFEISPVIEADDPEVLKAPLVAGVGLMMATDMVMRGPCEQDWSNPSWPAGKAVAQRSTQFSPKGWHNHQSCACFSTSYWRTWRKSA
jgi:DNA-binding transcriptional LysR family regulator